MFERNKSVCMYVCVCESVCVYEKEQIKTDNNDCKSVFISHCRFHTQYAFFKPCWMLLHACNSLYRHTHMNICVFKYMRYIFVLCVKRPLVHVDVMGCNTHTGNYVQLPDLICV